MIASLLALGSPGVGPARQVGQSDPVQGVVQELRGKNYAGAVAKATAALKERPNDPRLWTLQGVALSAMKPEHPAEALPAFEHALKIEDRYLPALEGIAQAEYTLNDPAARGHLERILAIRPAEETANGMLAVLDYRAGDFAAAAKHFEAAQTLIAKQPQALAQYAASLAQSGQLVEAEPVFAKLAALQPGETSAVYNLALAQYQLERPREALTQLTPLIAAPDASEDALTLAAEVHESLGETQQSLDLLRRATILHPKAADAYIAMAHVAFAHSSVQVGLDVLNIGIRNIPGDSRLYVARGVLLSQLGRSDEAGKDFDEATRLDPKLSTTVTARGIAQSQQHQDEAALATFRAAAQGHPDDALAQYLLAEALSNKNPEPSSLEGREELSAALRAAQLDPKLAGAQDLLATIYLRQEDYAKAAAASHAALALDANDQQAIYHLVLTARKGVDKEQLPALVKRLSLAREAGPNPLESPRGFLVEAK